MNNTMTPTYTMLFGGSAGEAGELGKAVMRVPAKRVIDTALKIIELYKNQRAETVCSFQVRVVMIMIIMKRCTNGLSA